MAKIKPEFDKRGVKIIGLSVDPIDLHQEVGGRHQGDARRRAELSDDRRPGPFHRQALRHAAGEHVRHVAGTHAGRQPDGAQRVRHRPRQEGQAHHGLPDDHRPQFRRGAARHQLDAAHRQAPGGDAGQLEERRGCDHCRLGVATRRRKRFTRKAGSRRGPISASCRSRRAHKRSRPPRASDAIAEDACAHHRLRGLRCWRPACS